MADRFGPIDLPAHAWQRPEVRAALHSRDVAALLSLAQRYSGSSQARLATAIGLGQGRVNEIINGRRQVGRLGVFERIAEGLAMPDDARIMFGIAPARAVTSDTLTGHAEIAHVFTSQAEANREIRELSSATTQITVLAARALGLIALNDSLLRGPISERTTSVRVRVLLLDPDAEATAIRAAEIGESAESFAAGIHLAVSRLAEFAGHPFIRLQTKVYDALPTWRIIGFDQTLYLSAFGTMSEGHRSGLYKLTAAADGVLHAGFRRYFDDLWRQSRHPHGEEPAERDRG
jgi:transcriptional regulator with XRE-family HTH domain